MNSIGHVVLQPASNPVSGEFMAVGLLAAIGILLVVLGLGKVLSWTGL